MKLSHLTEIVATIAIICISIAIIGLIQDARNMINDDHTVEYQYKEWSNYDIGLAMKYHGIDFCNVSETEAYFYGKNNTKIKLFTDDCIKYIIKKKQEAENE